LTLVSFNLLLLGVFLALQTLIASRSPGRADVRRILKHGATAVVTFLVAQVMLMAAFGYRPLAVFKTAVALQVGLLRHIQRPYPQTILFDLTDFALGSGWIAVVVLVLYLVRQRRRESETETALVAAGLVQIVFVAAVGLLPGETARVWIFLLPLLMLPVGLELARWTFAARMMAYASLWLVTAQLAQHMQFL
jgi:hypothetical protein